MSATTYTPEAGSLGDRILQLFKRSHKDENYAALELTRKFDVALPVLWAAVEPLVSAGVLAREPNNKAASSVIQRGPRFPLAPPPAAAAPAAEPKKPGRQAGKPPLPDLDLEKLVVRTGVPRPPRFMPMRAGESKYDSLFAKLTAKDQSIDLPAAYQKTLSPAVRKRSKTGPQRFSLRRTSVDTVTLWRDA